MMPVATIRTSATTTDRPAPVVQRELLIVEDEPDDVRIVRAKLDDCDEAVCRVRAAATLLGALKALEQHSPDAILLDLNLPDSRGLHTLKAVQRAAENVPIIVLTGLSRPGLFQEILRGGAQDYLVKGQFGARELHRAVRHSIERKRQQLELQQRERFLTLTSDLSRRFLQMPVEGLAAAIEAALERLGHRSGADCVTIWAGSPGERHVGPVHYWRRTADVTAPPRFRCDSYSWSATKLAQTQPLLVRNVADLPEEAAPERRAWLARGVHGAYLFPMVYGDQLAGGLEFAWPTTAPAWPDYLMPMLRMVADVFAAALARLRHDRAAQNHRRELERCVRQRTTELQNANQELRAFSYSVSHDLRAPLRVLRGFSQALLEDDGSDTRSKRLDYARRIHRAAVRMDGLVEGMLTLSRATSDPLERVRVDLSQLTESIADDLREQADRRALQFRIEGGLEVRGDSRLLRSLMENLLENAVKFTAGREPAVIHVGYCPGTGAYYVQDNGVGFDAERADKLFVPFQRLHPDSEFDGSGIGLATCRRIVARHGGDIWAELRPCGSRFWFRIDRAHGKQTTHNEVGR